MNSTPNFIPDNQMPQNNSAPDFIPDEQADKYFNSQSQGNNGSFTRGASDVLRNIGLGIFPNMAANLTDEAKGVSNMVSGKGKYSINANDYNNPFRTYDQAKKSYKENPIISTAKDTAGLATYAMPETNLLKGSSAVLKIGNAAIRGGARGEAFGISQDQGENPFYPIFGALAEPLMAVLKSGKLTQKGINNAVVKAKDASVARGDFQTEEDLQKAIQDKLDEVDPHGLMTDLRQAVKDRINKLPSLAETTSPNSKGLQNIGPKQLSADWFHGLRQALDKEINWARQTNSPVTEQANKLIRGVASDQLHTMAPETKLLDTINHIYYSPVIKGGKIPLTNITAKYPANLTGVPSAVINALGALLGINEGAKLLKK